VNIRGGEGIRTLINSLFVKSFPAGERIAALPPHLASMSASYLPFNKTICYFSFAISLILSYFMLSIFLYEGGTCKLFRCPFFYRVILTTHRTAVPSHIHSFWPVQCRFGCRLSEFFFDYVRTPTRNSGYCKNRCI
jgi:hypothetical protein